MPISGGSPSPVLSLRIRMAVSRRNGVPLAGQGCPYETWPRPFENVIPKKRRTISGLNDSLHLTSLA